MKKYMTSFWGKVGISLLALFTIALFVACYMTATPTTMLASVGVAWPAGSADLQQPAYAATLAVTITDQLTILDPAILTGAMTINLTIAAGVRAGAIILTEITTTATEVATFGTGFTAPTQTGVAGKTKCAMFMYDGVTFKVVGTPIQID